MGKAHEPYIGIAYVLFMLTLKRGKPGLLSLFVANAIMIFIKDDVVVTTVKIFCVLCIFSLLFIISKNVKTFIRVFGGSTKAAFCINMWLIFLLLLVQLLIIKVN